MGQNESKSSESKRPHELRGVLYAMLGASCWGFSATCVSYLVDKNQVDIPWLACSRLLVAGLLFLAIAFVRDRDKFSVLFHDRGLMVRTGLYTLLAVVLMQISYMSGIKYTNAGTTLLLLEVSVPIVLVVECIRGRRFPKPVEMLALALAAGGVLSIATQGNLGSIGINPLGLMWGLLSAVANASYILLSVKVVEKCGSLVLNGVAMTLGAILFAPWAHPWDSTVVLDASGWIVFFAIVLVGTMFAYAIYLRGISYCGTVKASLVGVVEPISGAAISALWLGTVFSGWDLLGGVLIIAMMIIVALNKS
ncbi:MAG: EamA family transporter [Eggerthellaceae bacterium]|nr:EamA family transporter [Eggerthellaceae bacterium]